MQKIEMGPAAAADDLSQTIMADDGVLERVGKKEEQPKEPSPQTWYLSKNLHDRIFKQKFLHTKKNQRKCINFNYFSSIFVRVYWVCKIFTVSVQNYT